jgi:hypothetical protein
MGMEQEQTDLEQEPTDQSKPSYLRWMPLVVPLLAVAMAGGVYLIAAEVLTRIV